MLVDPAQDLGAVDLAQHDVASTHPGDGVQHPPAVAVELRERVQVDVAIADPEVPAERRGVQPDVAMRDLHAFGPRRRARRVVDGRRRVLIAFPRLRLDAEAHDLGIGLAPDHESSLALDLGQRIVELRVDEQQARPAVLDDVADLVGDEAEIDRHEDAAGPRHAEQRSDQPSGVVADDRDSLSNPDLDLVEAGGHRTGPCGDIPIGQRAPRLGRLQWLVDDADAIRVEQLGSVDEVVDEKRHEHGGSWINRWTCRTP